MEHISISLSYLSMMTFYVYEEQKKKKNNIAFGSIDKVVSKVD